MRNFGWDTGARHYPNTTYMFYVRDPGGELLASFDAAETPNKYYYHFDDLGSTVLVTNGSGTVSNLFLIAPEYAERSESPVCGLQSAVSGLWSPVYPSNSNPNILA